MKSFVDAQEYDMLVELRQMQHDIAGLQALLQDTQAVNAQTRRILEIVIDSMSRLLVVVEHYAPDPLDVNLTLEQVALRNEITRASERVRMARSYLRGSSSASNNGGMPVIT